MTAYVYDRLVSEEEYRQRVRRHRPSSLLPLIAAAAARCNRPDRPQPWLDSPYKKYTPWALADAARVCLAYGTEHQRSNASEDDLFQILAAYSSLKDSTLFSADDPAVRLRDFMMRMSGEQMACESHRLARGSKSPAGEAVDRAADTNSHADDLLSSPSLNRNRPVACLLLQIEAGSSQGREGNSDPQEFLQEGSTFTVVETDTANHPMSLIL